MKKNWKLDKVAINVKSHRLLKELLKENPKLEEIMRNAGNEIEALIGVKNWILDILKLSPKALDFYKCKHTDRAMYDQLKWSDYAAIRILDYIDNAGREFKDENLRGEIAVSNPIKLIWLAANYGTGGAKPTFFEDMLQLFRQLVTKSFPQPPSKELLQSWMSRYPSGLDPRIVKLREENRDRIIRILIKKLDNGTMTSERFKFESDLSWEQKYQRMLEWWENYLFHLQFAIRDPDTLNELLGYSLDPDTMKILYDAKETGIPFFVNPYYLSLLHVRVPYFAIGADLAIRHYVLYSKKLVEEFGHIHAWEKEDIVKPGKPNAAGWLLPFHNNIHRRYPEVAIIIPDTMGRACGGLCSACQRMYNFQSGNLNFDLEALKPTENWPKKLKKIMKYFEDDTQLRDILITGGDALMSSNKTLEATLDAVYEMSIKKRKKNQNRKEGEKFAEIIRIRLGTRLPAYLPQRVNKELTDILSKFKKKASAVGIKQFVIQTHFESPMEITPESTSTIEKLLEAGWMVTNQLVFTVSASRRGHTAKLRHDLNEIGVLPYYTFSVKGYMENYDSFATNARAVQEQLEEKIHGNIPSYEIKNIEKLPEDVPNIPRTIKKILNNKALPFLATDRNALNLPGVGKSLTYRVIGITRYGRRILEFDHDSTRQHSPIIEKLGKIVVIESKSIREYLDQLESLGENSHEYEGLYGYSIGVTEPQTGIFNYPDYDFSITDRLCHFDIK